MTGVALCSANDCPQRDPQRVRLEATLIGGQTVTLATAVLAFSARWQYRFLRFDHPVVATELVLWIDEVR